MTFSRCREKSEAIFGSIFKQYRFIVLLNSKSYKKATESAASYPKYAGNISEKLGKLTPDGFKVLDAGIKIFEIKNVTETSPQKICNRSRGGQKNEPHEITRNQYENLSRIDFFRLILSSKKCYTGREIVEKTF